MDPETPLDKYIAQAVVGFLRDPADSPYQRGYLAALLDMRSIFCPHVQLGITEEKALANQVAGGERLS